jgi:mannose-6-phosphate isomerase-like protein (cupin superfamily)
MKKVSLMDKFERFSDHWHPRIVAELNDTQVKVVKLQGEFHWHHHENEDELFLVMKGRLCIEFRTSEVWLGPGELMVVPKGVEHRPVAPEEVHLVLIEPRGTLNTGNVGNERTIEDPEWL